MKTLLNEDDLLDLITKTKIFITTNNNIPEIINTFKVFNELKVKPEILAFNEQGFCKFSEYNFERYIPIIEIFDCAKKLIQLRKYKGFHKLSDGFNNQTQFADTMFEVACIFFTHQHSPVKEIEISPEGYPNNKKKTPDFVFYTHNLLECFCECKSLVSSQRLNDSKAFRLMREINSSIQDLMVDNYRVEITFRHLPPHWNKNYDKQLRSAIQVLIERNFMQTHLEIKIDEKYETFIKLCHLKDPVYFKSLINCANGPPTVATLIIGEIPNLKKNIKHNIRDALTHFPKNKPSIIFLCSLDSVQSGEAIKEYYRDNNKKLLAGIFTLTDKFRFHLNPKTIINVNDNIFNAKYDFKFSESII